MTAAEVGRELADIVEAERPALTYVLTATAQQRIAERRAMSDRDYETMLRAWMEIPAAD
jgi:hypothetical protein